MSKIKKIISVIFTLSLILSCCAIPASAADSRSASLTPQLVTSSYEVDDSQSPDRGTETLSFSNLAKGYSKKSPGTYYLTKNVDELKISSLTWTPSGQKVSVAFVNAQSGATYAVEYSGGSASNTNINTSTVPTGEYYVAIINYNGPNAVTGALSYSWK